MLFVVCFGLLRLNYGANKFHLQAFMEINISIGERLREQRELMGKSQTEFALIAVAAGVPGATRQSQAKYEKGLASASAAYMAAIAAAGVDVMYVLTGQRSKSVTPAMSRRAAALIDNYENTDEAGKKIIEGTAALAAQSKTLKKA